MNSKNEIRAETKESIQCARSLLRHAKEHHIVIKRLKSDPNAQKDEMTRLIKKFAAEIKAEENKPDPQLKDHDKAQIDQIYLADTFDFKKWYTGELVIPFDMRWVAYHALDTNSPTIEATLSTLDHKKNFFKWNINSINFKPIRFIDPNEISTKNPFENKPDLKNYFNSNHVTYNMLDHVERIPDRRILFANSNINPSNNDKPGQSFCHNHDGIELLIALDAVTIAEENNKDNKNNNEKNDVEIEVRFPCSGITQKIKIQDFMLFPGNLSHYVINQSNKTVKLLAIRIIGFDTAPQDNKSVINNFPIKDLINLLCLDGKVIDSARFGQCLGAIYNFKHRYSSNKKTTLKSIQQYLAEYFDADTQINTDIPDWKKRKSYFNTPVFLTRFHAGNQNNMILTVNDLCAFAEAYDIEPILLYQFLLPPVDSYAVFQNGTHDFVTIDKENSIFKCANCIQNAPRPVYKIPTRRMANLDLDLMVIEFGDERCETPENSHAGYEIIIPLEINGEIKTHVKDECEGENVNVGDIVYFRSHIKHKVEGKNAKMLAIRIGQYSDTSN